MNPDATSTRARRRSSVSPNPNPNGTYKFPDLAQDSFPEDTFEDFSRDGTPKPLPRGLPHGLHSSERWPARRASNANNWNQWSNATPGKTRHGRQKSLSEAIQTVRGRKASISENAHEIAESLKAPISWKLILLCCVWYGTSIMTNASSKAILTALRKPVTLTIVQFLLVSFWCIFLSWLAKHSRTLRDIAPFLKQGIRKPSKEIILVTLPLTGFQIGGHILNSDAMSKIPVSLVHTIKGLSPLMTVVAYRVFYDIRYSTPTYLSLIPLTAGVIMACAADTSTNFFGLLNAFGSAVLFVTQNIVSKKIFNEAAKAEADGTPVGRRKPDKLNLLCYSSALAFLITVPIWVFSEGWALAQDFMQDASITLREKPGSLDHGALAAEFLFNGTFHFAQSLVAFMLLGLTSPVTYSVASLMKRVAVILFAIVWFGNPMTYFQGAGFALTFLGLYLYDRMSETQKADKRAKAVGESRQPLLPINVDDYRKNDPTPPVYTNSPVAMEGAASGYVNGELNGAGRQSSYALPLGTKAEETWRQDDVAPSSRGIGVR